MVAIKLIIKAPNQKLDDHSIDCELEWDVLRLKTHLSSAYPTKPRIEEQRLIYSGHLLKNEQSLRDVLQPIDDNSTFTIHLVCAQRSQDSPKRRTTANGSNRSEMSAPNNSAAQQNNNEGSQRSANESGFNASSNVINPILPMGIAGANAAPIYMTPEQMMQSAMYLQQAYAQYMAQFGYNLPQVMPTAPVVTQNVPQLQPQLQQQPPQQPPQQLNAGPAGAAAAADDEDDPLNRDWLDWFYWISRAVVLFSIIYFYSSFSRFVVVIALAFMLYIYQTGFLNRRHAIRPNVNNNNNNNNDANLINNNDDNERIVNANENVPQVEPNDDNRRVNGNNDISEQRTEDRFLTGLRFVWVVISSLFTSLIPDHGAPPVNVN